MFLALVKEPFSLLLDNRAAGLFLLKIDDDHALADSEQFTVVFQASRKLIVREGTYVISHLTAGTTHMFVQPGGHDGRYNYYKAPFNLLREGG